MVCVANPICTSGGPTLIFCESVCRVNKTLSFFQWFHTSGTSSEDFFLSDARMAQLHCVNVLAQTGFTWSSLLLSKSLTCTGQILQLWD